MRTTLNLDDKLVKKAMRETGIKEKTALIHEALRSLRADKAARRLAALGGTMPDLEDIPRHRSTPSSRMRKKAKGKSDQDGFAIL